MILPRPADGCPACLAAITGPHTVHLDGPSCLLALYKCPGCGHRWRTWWNLPALALDERNAA